jgi:hypothetical protein
MNLKTILGQEISTAIQKRRDFLTVNTSLEAGV